MKTLFLLQTVVCALVTCFSSEAEAGPPVDLALVGALIYPAPGEPPIADGVVLVAGGVIEAVGRREEIRVPDGASVLDCSGLALTSGFWNNHVHLNTWRLAVSGWLPAVIFRGELERMATRYGFVHVVDTGSWLPSTARLRDRILSGKVAGPSIRTSGLPFVPEGASPYYSPVPLPALSSPNEARDRVNEALDSGADLIKLMTGSLVGPDSVVVMSLDVVRAAVEAAHERGALVFAHPSNSAGARAAIEGGVDVLAHTFPTEVEGPWDRSLIPEIERRSTALVPTLKLWRWVAEHEMKDHPEYLAQVRRAAREQVQAFNAIGGRILFGTDIGGTGSVNDYDPTDEYLYLAEGGLSFSQILASLTSAPAERFGVGDRTGRVAPGFDADLVALAGDPSVDLRALARVRYTLRRGEILYRAEPVPDMSIGVHSSGANASTSTTPFSTRAAIGSRRSPAHGPARQ
jgi:imidazolonepropionase-like amidohydrolase